MANYFIDFEFIEGFHKPLFGKPSHCIDLISVGIVCEDGREYYAISKEFNPKHANSWVKEHVISKLPARDVNFYDSPKMRSESLLWKSNDQIKNEILNFFGYEPEWTEYGSDLFSNDSDIRVYGYYASYDWVLLCSLFGTMMDLPDGFPMYCRDLKQTIDEVSYECSGNLEMWGKGIEKHPDYPKQVNEHNALEDAKWNKRLYEFLQTL